MRILDMRDARSKACTRGVMRTPVAEDEWSKYLLGSPASTGDFDTGVAEAFGPTRPGVKPISNEEWERGYEVKGLPFDLILPRDTRDMLARILAKSPGRKRGRPPLGEKAMTSTERSRKHHAAKKIMEDA
jgi:hypothetical protein